MKADIQTPDRPYTILLFYKYTDIADPEALRDSQKTLMAQLNLKGRTLISAEGINGTLAGLDADTEEYIRTMHADPRFSDIFFKKEYYHKNPFPGIRVKVRSEIVASGKAKEYDETIVPQKLSPKEFHDMMQEDNVVILDARNNFEARIGRFKNAITPDIDHFRDFPEWMDQHKDVVRGKKVLMYCNGNIRCEKSSIYVDSLKEAEEVYSLQDGIVNYTAEIPDGLWEGSLYVFDDRTQVQLNDDEHHTIISTCDFCDTACDTYYNCSNAECNKMVILCDTCAEDSNGACSEECSTKHRAGVVKKWNIKTRQAE